MKISYLVPLAVFAALAGLLFIGLQREPGKVPSPLVGQPLPEFVLPAVEDPDRTLASGDLEGEPLVLNVWASWCTACRTEHPLLVAARNEAPIFGLNYKDDRDDALAWLERFGDPYRTSGYDRDGKVGLDLGVYGVPETFIVDRSGRIAHKHIGPLTARDWTETVRPLLRRLRNEAR